MCPIWKPPEYKRIVLIIVMLYIVYKLLQVESICYAITDSSKIIGKESREENKVMHVIKTKPKHPRNQTSTTK